MATHSSVLAWRIPGTVEPGGLPSIGSHRVRHDWSDLAAAAVFTCHKEGLIFNSFIFPISFSFFQHCPMFIFAYLINNQSLCYCECNHFSCNPYKLLCSYFLSWILFWIKNCDVCVCMLFALFSTYLSLIHPQTLPECQSVSQFSRSVVSNLWPHGLQHARFPCPSPTPEAYSNSCPWSQWCHPTISSFVVPSPPNFNFSQHQGLF